MKLSRYLLGSLAITVLYGASCTTTINNYGPPPSDLARPPDLGPPPDLTTYYKLANGTYQTTNAIINSDTCMYGLSPAAVSNSRMVTNDGMGNVTISTQNGTVLCMGMVSMNIGRLTNVSTYDDSICRGISSRVCALTLTGDNQFKLDVTDNRSNIMSDPGRTCTTPDPCQVGFTINMKM